MYTFGLRTPFFWWVAFRNLWFQKWCISKMKRGCSLPTSAASVIVSSLSCVCVCVKRSNVRVLACTEAFPITLCLKGLSAAQNWAIYEQFSIEGMPSHVANCICMVMKISGPSRALSRGQWSYVLGPFFKVKESPSGFSRGQHYCFHQMICSAVSAQVANR